MTVVFLRGQLLDEGLRDLAAALALLLGELGEHGVARDGECGLVVQNFYPRFHIIQNQLVQREVRDIQHPSDERGLLVARLLQHPTYEFHRHHGPADLN